MKTKINYEVGEEVWVFWTQEWGWIKEIDVTFMIDLEKGVVFYDRNGRTSKLYYREIYSITEYEKWNGGFF